MSELAFQEANCMLTVPAVSGLWGARTVPAFPLCSKWISHAVSTKTSQLIWGFYFTSSSSPLHSLLSPSSFRLLTATQKGIHAKMTVLTVGARTRAQPLGSLTDVDYSLLYFHLKNILGFILMTPAMICLQHTVISSDLEALGVPLNEGS